MTWGKFRQMTAKEYREISDITYKIQDLADELLKFEFKDQHKALYDIAQGIQDYRDLESGSLTDKQIEEA